MGRERECINNPNTGSKILVLLVVYTCLDKSCLLSPSLHTNLMACLWVCSLHLDAERILHREGGREREGKRGEGSIYFLNTTTSIGIGGGRI